MNHKKLVRDKIPEYIAKQGGKPIFYVADEEEYHEKLLEKVIEEFEEFKVDENIEEYADLLEVLDAIAEYKGFIRDEIDEFRNKKAEERGRFKKRIILDE